MEHLSRRLRSSWAALPRGARIGGAVVVALAVVAAVVLTVLPRGPSRPPPTAPSTSPPAQATSPLTGLPGAAGRILTVKIDNVADARPQTAVNAADIVYAIEVEGGLSRFLAVYDDRHLPGGDRIGPVRSARESDLQVLQQYGKVAFAYSGALSRFLPVLARADLFTCTPVNCPGAFFRAGPKIAPFNEYLRPSQAMRAAPGSAQARDIGFRFGPAPAGGRPTATYQARMPAASFTFTWSPGQHKYLVSMDGRPARTTDGGQMGAPTVVVQKVAETTSPRGFQDSPGVPSPYAPTVGRGDAVVLRDGSAYDATWSRPDAGSGTTFTFQGRPMTFHPGQVWIVLEPR